MEDAYLGKATERLFLPLLRVTLPEIVDMNLPVHGVFHNLAIISIKKEYPAHARKVMHALWGLGQMMFTKTLIVVDHDVNVHDLAEVTWIAGNHIDPKRDTVFVDGPVDVLDHAAPVLGYGSKFGIDATRKWRSEGFEREWPERHRHGRENQENTSTQSGKNSDYERAEALRQSKIKNLKSKIADYGSLVRFSHTVFALPFALSSVALAWPRHPVTLRSLFWILVAMVGARTAAMGFNRLADRKFDALNPRTQDWELPRGAVEVSGSRRSHRRRRRDLHASPPISSTGFVLSYRRSLWRLFFSIRSPRGLLGLPTCFSAWRWPSLRSAPGWPYLAAAVRHGRIDNADLSWSGGGLLARRLRHHLLAAGSRI